MNNNMWRCNECGHLWEDPLPLPEPGPDFCPKCGSDDLPDAPEQADVSVGEIERWFVEQPGDVRLAINRAVEREYGDIKGHEMRYIIQRRHIIAAMRQAEDK